MKLIYFGWLHHELRYQCKRHGIWLYKGEKCPLCTRK